MSILSDTQIRELCIGFPTDTVNQVMIDPFVDKSVRSVSFGGDTPDSDETTATRKILSYGLSSYGYDVRLDEKIKIFTNVNSSIIDPKRPSEQCMIDATVQLDDDGARYVILPPNSYLLGVTHEYFDIPRDIMVICVGKSTYARSAVIVNTTPIEPGFKGNVVLELANGSSLPVKVYIDEGVAQFMFFRGSKPCETSYADRDGKYQNQTGITLSRV